MGIANLGFQLTGAMIGWILTGIVALFVVSGLLWGVIRGLQKTTFRGLWLILTAVILVLLTPVITKWLINIDLSGFNLEIEGEKVTTINDVIEYTVSQIDGMEDAVSENPILMEFVNKLPGLLINSVIFVLLFFLCKIVLWPIWAILAGIFIKKYKTVNGVKGKKMPKAERIKVPKQRGWGCLVGAVCGLFVGGILMMPVNGILDMAQTLNTANTSFITAEPSEEGIVDYYMGEYSDILAGASNNVGSAVLKYTGLGYINKWTFDELSSMKIGKDKIVLKDETKGVVNVLNSIGKIRCYDFENLTQKSLAEILTASRVVVNYLFELKTVTVVGDDVVPYIAKKIAENGDLINTGAEQTDAIVDEALLEVAKVNMEYLKNELNALINVVEVANNADVLLPLIYKDIPFETYIERCNDKFVDDFVEALFSSKIFTAISATAINEGLDLAMKQLEIADFEKNAELTNTTVKTEFKNILSSIIAMSKHMDVNPIKVEKEALAPLGKMLNSFKNITTAKSFGVIVDKISDEVSGILSEGYKETLSKAISNLKTIDNYETEFKKLDKVWDDLVELKDSNLSDFSTLDTQKLGRVLDKLRDSEIFGPVIDELVVDALTEAQKGVVNGLEDEELKNAVNDAFTIMIWNINDTTLVRGEHFWEEEFTALGGMLDIDLSNDSLNASNIKNLGKIIDSMRDSTLMTRKVNEEGNSLNGENAFNVLLAQVFETATKSVVEGEPEGSQLINIVNEIKHNLLNLPSDVTYESEMSFLSEFMDEFENLDPSGLTPNTTEFNNTMTNFGKNLDSLGRSKVFVTTTKDLRQDMLKYFVDEINSKMTASLSGTIDRTPITGDSNSLIADMIAGVNNMPRPESLTEGQTPYQTEMGHLANLINELYGISNYDTLLSDNTKLTNLGNALDNIKQAQSILCENAGYYIIKMFVNSINSLENFKNTIINETIADNIKNEFIANAEKVNKTNYNMTLANYSMALTSFKNIKTIFEEVDSNFTNITINTFDVNKFAKIFNDLQSEMMADWNVTQYVAEFALNELEADAIKKLPEVAKTDDMKTKSVNLINQIRLTKCEVLANKADIETETCFVNMTGSLDETTVSGLTLYNYVATTGYTSQQTNGYIGLFQAIKDKVTDFSTGA